jgi:hypothetical protein
MSKKITFGLSVKEIQRAIQEVESYKKELNSKCQLLVQALTDQGIEIAKFNVRSLGAFYTGELEQSINGYYSPSLGTGIIYAGAWYAMYIEFGSGIRGSEAPHPLSGKTGWHYDVNDHGESGWVYYNENDGSYHWTDGMPSRPFLYETGRKLELICEKIAKAVFN